MSTSKLLGSSLFLFLDNLIVAAGNWIYWIMISKIVSISAIGQSTTVYNFVLLTSTLTQLGLEYPLLKRSMKHRPQILMTTLLIELVIVAIAIPFVIYFTSSINHGSLQDFTWIAIGLLIFSSAGFIVRFALLGVSDARSVLIIDIIGTGARFAVAYALVSAGFGALGLLLSLLVQSSIIMGATLYVTRWHSFEFRLGNPRYIKEIMKDGLVNTPSKISRTVILSLSVVLLAVIGISGSNIGLFYLALMITIVAGSLAGSIAFMIIPASSESNTELSSYSARIGLSLTAPLIALLISAPKSVLTVLGQQYESADLLLFILAIGILPSSVVMIAISRLNNLNQSRKLISVGSIQISSFIASFFIFAPHFGTEGAAVSMLIAFTLSAIPSVIWAGRQFAKAIANSSISILVGVTAGYLVSLVITAYPVVVISTSVSITVIVLFAIKNTSIREMTQLAKSVIHKNGHR
jgi:O-antigen/teichoic acid export membrane protein